jgi:hypothetical protein
LVQNISINGKDFPQNYRNFSSFSKGGRGTRLPHTNPAKPVKPLHTTPGNSNTHPLSMNAYLTHAAVSLPQNIPANAAARRL